MIDIEEKISKLYKSIKKGKIEVEDLARYKSDFDKYVTFMENIKKVTRSIPRL